MMNGGKRKIELIEYVGLFLVAFSFLMLVVNPGGIGNLFNNMFNHAAPIIIKVYITGSIGIAIIISVTMGRLLERLGFTDALMRIFVPLMKVIGVNAAVAVPSVYNILGDINAAGRIGGPILKKSKATKDEQKIAIATMMQSQSSFAIFVFGLIALNAAKVSVWVVVFLAVFLPVLLTPLLLRLTIWRDTKAVSLEDLPRFTPETGFLPTIFNAAKEGAELLFLLIIPSCAVVFAAIGALDHFGLWTGIQAGINTMAQCLQHPCRNRFCFYFSRRVAGNGPAEGNCRHNRPAAGRRLVYPGFLRLPAAGHLRADPRYLERLYRPYRTRGHDGSHYRRSHQGFNGSFICYLSAIPLYVITV